MCVAVVLVGAADPLVHPLGDADAVALVSGAHQAPATVKVQTVSVARCEVLYRKKGLIPQSNFGKWSTDKEMNMP